MHKEIFYYFFRLGLFGFGGPLALISNMQIDLVEKRKWIDEDEFNSAFSLIKAMPGPVAFMTAVYFGKRRGGNLGGNLAAIGIVLPSAVLMVLFSLFFSNLIHIPAVKIILLGMQACALGVILGSLKGLIAKNITDWFFWVLVIFSGGINYFYPSLEPVVIILLGLMIVSYRYFLRTSTRFDLAILFLVCFKAGALVFGSGLAIVPMLKYDVVTVNGWLSESEFLNALAFGQMTPGPVVITATFIGHHVQGIVGAIVATFAIFCASFFHMMTWFPHFVKKLSGKNWINDFVFGAVAAVVGPIITTVIKLYLSLDTSWMNLAFLFVALFLTLKNKVPLWLIIPGGGVVYLLLKASIEKLLI